MRPVTVVVGTMLPLPRSDVDTDQIMPKQFLTRIERAGFGDFVFFEWRKQPDFVMNIDTYAGATILVAGPNFGCGSSREHAAWGLQQYGFDAIIAPSFSDVFSANCRQIGLLLARVSDAVSRQLCESAITNPGTRITLDLVHQSITADGLEAGFDISSSDRDALLRGLDDVDLLRQYITEIERYERSQPTWLPSAHLSE